MRERESERREVLSDKEGFVRVCEWESEEGRVVLDRLGSAGCMLEGKVKEGEFS